MAAKSLPGFGKRLKEIRARAGLSQPELAHLLGANPSEISRWERDETFPQAARLRDLCVALKISADYLLGLQRPPGEEPDALRRFRATRWGKLAEENGWMDALRGMTFPMEPTVELYRDMVKAMLDVVETGDDPAAG